MTNNFKERKVLVFGLGLNQGGVGSARFFATRGGKVRITDLRSAEVLKPSIDELKQFPDIEYSLEGHKNEDIDWADLIIKNPAVKPNNPFIKYALENGKQVETDMGIFLEFVNPSQIIGVSGTKGKSTTASLIYDVLKAAGKNVIFAGNIGKSVLDTIPQVREDALVVLEISSFQLEAFDQKKISPKWAIITNITPDHLNYYSSLKDYINAKRIIGKYQTKDDYLFIRQDDPKVDQVDFLEGLDGQIIRFSKNDLPARNASQRDAGGPKDFKPQIIGEHNLENIAAAYEVGKTFSINSTLLLKTLADFKGVPFRMELIKEWSGIKIINDTAATSPESAIKAIQTYPNCILICGGMNKGMDYTKYVEVIEQNVKKVFFLEGDSTEEIKRLVIKKDLIMGTYNDLEKLLSDVKKIVKTGDNILLSPAATSFNLFNNEWDRGKKFNEAAEKVFK